MKKIVKLLSTITILIVVLFGLLACSFGQKLPGSSHEKVQFALNGVESSLKESKSKNLSDATNSAPTIKLMAKSISGDSLSTIYNAMEVEKITDNPDFKYDEPPMIQFQYLKALYEEIGEDFVFGTKYTDTVNGSIYYDFDTRTAPEEEKYLNNYTFVCSVSLDIDSDDLITASVGFDLTFINAGISRHQKMYVEMLLDYDMDQKKPTYELALNVITDLLDYEDSEEQYFNDEYDYVKVDKNSIKEWRKFGICSPTSLADYQNKDFVYKYSALRAFKDSKKYKTTNSFDKSLNLKNAVIDCLDLSNSISAYNSFFALQGTNNTKIKVCIDKFSGIFGKDIVNSIVYTGATEKWESDKPVHKNLFLRAILNNDAEALITEDYALVDLFNPNGNVIFGEKGGKKNYISIYLKNGETEDVAIYNNFDELNNRIKMLELDNAKIKQQLLEIIKVINNA